MPIKKEKLDSIKGYRDYQEKKESTSAEPTSSRESSADKPAVIKRNKREEIYTYYRSVPTETAPEQGAAPAAETTQPVKEPETSAVTPKADTQPTQPDKDRSGTRKSFFSNAYDTTAKYGQGKGGPMGDIPRNIVAAKKSEEAESEKYSVGKGLAGIVEKGVNQAAQGVASMLALAEDIVFSPFELFSGQQLGDISDTAPLNMLSERIRNEGRQAQEKYAENVSRGGKAGELLDKYGSMTVAAVPQAVIAALTAGASAGASAASLGTAAAAEMSPSIVGTIRRGVTAMAKDPQYWTSFAQVVGTSYDDALADMRERGDVGAYWPEEDGSLKFSPGRYTETQIRTKAALYAFGNGLMNAAVEVGGGIQKLPEELKHGRAAWKAWVDSAIDEGKEEVVQGVLERATQNVVYDKGNPLASTLDANAILNPRTAGEEFLGGAIVGGVLGAGQVGANAALKALSRFDNTLGENGRKAIRTSYQEGADTVEHIRDFVPAYNAGVEGKPNPNPKSAAAFAGYAAGQNDARVSTETAKNVSDVSFASTQTQDAVTGPLASSRVRSETMQSEITPLNAKNAQNAPQAARESGLVYDDYVMREMDSSTASEINTVARALGVRVRMADEVLGGKANGQIEGSDILIAKDATDPVMQVVGHEWTHRVQQLAPEQYRAFRDAVAANPDVAEAANILHRQYNRMGVEINSEQALDEATANYAGEMIANTDVLNDFIQRHREDRTLLEKLRDAIREIVGKLTGRAKRQAQTAEGLLQQAYEAAAKNSKKAATEGGGARYHLNEQFSQQFDEWNSRKVDNKGVGSFLVGTTSEALQSVGVADCEIYWRKAKVAKIMSEHPAMTADVIKSVPDILENPIIVMQSQTVANRITIFGETVDADGKPVLAVLELSPQNKRGEIQDFSVIASAYGKNNAQQMLDNSDILYVDPNKKRTDSWLGLLRLQLPSSLTNYGSIGSITLVNRDVNGNLSFGEGSSKTAMQEAFERAKEKTKFSLKSTVEETRDLLALHNKDEKSILAALELGGLPMPSIAVVKASEGHSKYGPISLVFSKATIDPQADSRNKVYGGDAWTPTSPRLEYEANSGAEERLRSKYYELAERVGRDNARPLYDYAHELEDALNSNGGEAGLLERHKDDTRMMNLFLADSGRNMVQDINTETVTRLDDEKIKLYDHLIQRLGEDVIGEMRPVGGESPVLARKRWVEAHGTELEAAYSSYLAEHGIEGETLPAKKLMPELVRARNYLANGPETRRMEFDAEATHKAIREAVDPAKYEAWLHNLFDGVEGRKGLYNGKEIIDRNGNRRAWGQLHYAYTLENIVKAMRDVQSERGQSFWGVSATGIQALATPSYKSIQDIKADSGRLGLEEGSEYDAKVKLVDDAISNVLGKIVKKTGGTMDYDYAATALKNAAGGKKTVDAIIKSFAADGYKISSKTAQDIQGIFKAALEIPTGYFEAKPWRAVGFDEVLAAVIPDNSSEKLRSALAGKGVNVLTYESGNEADRLAKINSVDDAQFSLKGTENAKELAALKRENEALRERVDYWKRQTRRSDGVHTDRKSVEQTANKLARDYSAEIEGTEIAGDLQNLYDYIARGGDAAGELTYTEARKRADAIAEKIAENSMAKDEELYQEYSELRKFLRTTKLTLSAEDAASITDYAELRKSLFGKVNLAKGEHTNVDRIYSEMADSYPEFFDEMRESNVSDQVQRIADIANSIYNVSEYNPFEGYMGQAVASISNDIMERFFDLPQAKKTFADRMTAQVQEARQSGRQAARDAMLAGQMAQGRADAVRLRNTQQALAKERDRRAAQVQELRERFREKDETRRDSQKRRTLRAKIVRHANTLSQKLLRPTDKQHIPEEMRSAVAAVLNSINQESRYTVDGDGKRVYDNSGTPTKRTAAFRALKERYQNVLAEGGDMVIDPSLLGSEADGVKGGFDRVIAMGDKRLSELSAGELQTMWQVVKAVEKSVSTAGKLLSGGKYETTQEMADAFRSDTRTRRRKLGGNRAISLETPYTFFAHYGQTGRDIYRMLRNAQDAQEIMARDIAEKTQRVLGERATAHGVREAVTSARGNNVWKLEAETHDFTTARGDSLTLTTSQVMELYLLGKRKQAQDHLMSGGIYQPEIRDAATGKVKVPRGTQAVFLTAEDVGRIASSLTAEQKKIADGLQQLTTDTLAKYGNDASMKAYGYRKFTEKDYWPIRSAKEGLHSSQEKDAGNVRSIKNSGMAQQVTPHAKTPLEIGSVFDTYARHASDMIDYAAWLNPMEDANRLFNFRYKNSSGADSGVTLKGLLDEKGGQGSQRYWMKLMGDIQNGIGTKDFEPIADVFVKGVGKFKGAAVGANIRVVIQQPTAFFRASAVLDPADMAKGLTGGVTKGSGWEKALEHSPIAMRKDVGSFDISSPYTMKERFYGKEGAASKLNDLAGAAAGKADAVTWGKLWNACEWQVKREKPELRAGTNAFYEAVNEAFTDMIDQTQVVDGILQRSNIMRGKSTLSQQATAFMGEPIMSLNVFLRSYDRFRYENDPKKRTAAMKNVGRAATALLVTNVVNAMAQSVVDALRDDDRDKDYWEKFFSAFTGIEGDEEGAAEKIAHVVLNGNVGDNMNPVSQIPFVKDILSLTQGYSVARPDMEIFSDLFDASSTFIKSIDGSGKKTRAEATLGLFAAAGKLFGLPAYNIKRDLNAALRTFAQASGSIPYQYEVEKFTYNIGYAGNKSRFMSILYDALEQGDYTSYDHIRRDLMESMGLDGEAITSALKTRYNKEVAEDPQHKLPQKALDMLGIRAKYAAPEEPEDKFGADDLAPAAYGKYEKKKADTYRVIENSMTGSTFFKGLEASVKDKALNNAEDYAEKTALAEASGGKYEITTKWVLDAQEAEKQYRIPPATYAALRAAASECTSLKDKDGETITYSKGLQVMELIYRADLTYIQQKAMFEYLDVPKGIRHYNSACVAEQLKKVRKKAK